MDRIAFKMKLHAGFSEEYKRRHDEIWPGLSSLLKESGIQDYAIYLDEETNTLFATLKVIESEKLDRLPTFDTMKQWWQYMADIMDTNEDYSPVCTPLVEMFYLE